MLPDRPASGDRVAKGLVNALQDEEVARGISVLVGCAR